ncbi:hypothetical protein [Vacuolonema iberomarrocanum]|uniref:hypothetical protein n=1 Tax=Vacuolonema iberomarrocanum TaxID=3454632 RepID=UPI0019DE52B6|nr:hypothetical protein [filamentous cyanobacterium LEGE 07170]
MGLPPLARTFSRGRGLVLGSSWLFALRIGIKIAHERSPNTFHDKVLASVYNPGAALGRSDQN